MTTGTWKQPVLKLGVCGACMIPLVVLAWQALTHRLGANPIGEITNQTGIWTLRLLLITHGLASSVSASRSTTVLSHHTYLMPILPPPAVVTDSPLRLLTCA